MKLTSSDLEFANATVEKAKTVHVLRNGTREFLHSGDHPDELPPLEGVPQPRAYDFVGSHFAKPIKRINPPSERTNRIVNHILYWTLVACLVMVGVSAYLERHHS